MAHWSDNSSDLSKFMDEIYQTQLDCGYPIKDDKGATLPETIARFQAWPFSDKLTNFLAPVDAAVSFQDWLIHRYIGGAKIPGAMRFEVSITYKLPPLAAAASVTFGCSAVLPSANADLRDRAFDWLTGECNRAYAQYLASPVQSESRANGNGKYDEFPVLALIHTFDKNEHVYKAKGGPFTLHGLRIYPEALEAAGIPADKLPIGETKPKAKWTATVIYNSSGKAYKVGELKAAQ